MPLTTPTAHPNDVSRIVFEDLSYSEQWAFQKLSNLLPINIVPWDLETILSAAAEELEKCHQAQYTKK